MKRTINHLAVNELAYHFAQTQDQWAFNQLYRELKPLITEKAQGACYRARRTGVYIPIEDFTSFFNQGLFQSTKGYNIRRGNFLPRLQANLKLREADVWRCYEIRGMVQSCRKYEKARLLIHSLDKPIKDSSKDNDLTLLDTISTPSLEESYLEKEQKQNILIEFIASNRKYGTIITLLDHGYRMHEIASIMGEQSYNARMRKLVQRTKHKFREYLKNRVI